VARSVSRTAVDSWLPGRRAQWTATPVGGYQEIFETLTGAIGGATRYIYIEDQYLAESAGASARYELYPHLRAAVERGVKLIFVGSGVRDPEDLGPFRPINRRVTRDIRRKILRGLSPEHRRNVGVWRVEHATVHAKLTMIDDVFANVGSANMFARSMSGVDTEISAAVVTSTPLVRDLRVALWAEHLRAPVTPALEAGLQDLDLALGIWRPEWLPAGTDPATWRRPDVPAGFRPEEHVLTLVGPR
jgi:phosphatidylserine/phosphatidylglycerophosphate/cardiolipin synthase-like enzyme